MARYIGPVTIEREVEARKIQTIAFHGNHDFSAPPKEPPKENKLRAAYVDDKMVACMDVWPFQMMFDGAYVPMYGLGGVASLPETRNGGHVRAMIESSLKEMQEAGAVFSVLYPFSHVYYRKFGYESTSQYKKTTIPQDGLSHLRTKGAITQLDPEKDKEALLGLYDMYIKRYNMAIMREEKHWKKWFDKDPYTTKTYAYLYRDEAGVLRGAMQCVAQEQGNEQTNLVILDLIFDGGEGLRGILSLLRSMGAQYEKYIIPRLPQHVELSLLVPECYDVSQTLGCSGMARVIDAQKALTLMKHPASKGSYTIAIQDPLLTDNNAAFTVSFGQGTRVERTDAPADLTVSIQAAAQLILGTHDLHTIALTREDVIISSHEDVLKSVFVKKDVHLNEHF